MKDKKIGNDLTQGVIGVQLLVFIGPLFISNILQTVYNVVDMAVVGHYVGKTGLSAVSVCGELVHVLMFIAMGFSNAGQVLISQYTGAGKRSELSRLIGTMLSLLFCIALVLTVLSFVFCDEVLTLSNVPTQALEDAKMYFAVSAGGLVFTYGYNAISAILRGMGDSKHPFIFIAISSLLNIVLDVLFVAVFGLGVFGVAFATVISQGISFVSSIIFLVRNQAHFVFDFKLESFRFNGESMSKLAKLGIPMALQSGFIQGSKLVVMRWVNEYGVNISAITGIGNKFNSIGLTFSGAVSTSGAAMIGQCIGARKYERVGKTVLFSGVLSVSIAALLASSVLLLPRPVFSIFTDETELLDMSLIYAPVVALMLLSSAFRAPMGGLISGSGNSRLNFLLAVLDGIAGHIGLSAFLSFAAGMGITGLWYGNAAAGFIPFFVGFIYYFSGKWRRTPDLK